MKTLTRALLIGAALPLVTLAGCSKSDTPATTTTAPGSSAPVSTAPGSVPKTTPPGTSGTTTTVKGGGTTTTAKGGGTTTTAATGGSTVNAKDFAFAPEKITVKAGDPLTFNNQDDVTHEPTAGTPTEKGDAFSPVTLKASTTAAVTITKPGVYAYYCAIHEEMKGEITVT